MTDADQLRKAIRLNLPRLRNKKKLTQGALAESIGVHRVTLARWETGDVIPSPEALFNLADALGVTVEVLGTIPEFSAIPT